MVAEADIERIKQETDLAELARGYGFQLKKSGKDHLCKCPFHEDENDSLSISTDKGLFHCFGCDAKGNAIQFVQRMDNLSFPEAVRKLSGMKSNTSATKRKSTASKAGGAGLSDARRRQMLEDAWQIFRKHFGNATSGREYLRSRGFALANSNMQSIDAGWCPKGVDLSRLGTLKELKEVGLLNTASRPRFADCVVFALRDVEGVVQGFYGRRVAGRGSHFYLPGERNGVFSSTDKQRHTPLHLVESVLDALALKDAGVSNVLALFGANGWTPLHAQFVQEHAKASGIHEVVSVMDGDEAGRKASDGLRGVIEGMGLGFRAITLPDGEDPCSMLEKGGLADLINSNHLPATEEEKAVPADSATTATTSDDNGFTLTREDEETLLVEGKLLRFRVLGLSAVQTEKMRVTLRIERMDRGGLHHLDSLDLYSSRQRRNLAQECADELAVGEDAALKELKHLVSALEGERNRLRAVAEQSASDEPAPMKEDEREEALSALRNPKLVENILADFAACGVIGEEKGKLLGYLGCISRLLPKPIGMVVVSRSGAGKTTLQNAVCAFVPEEHLVKYSRLTGQALFYKEDGALKHKVLAIEEEEGMSEAMYSIKLLQSDQRLSVASTRSDPKSGKLRTEEHTVTGPVFILVSTTRPDALDHETRSRFVIATIDESPAQTKRILEHRRWLAGGEGKQLRSRSEEVARRQRNMQRLLRPLRVENPLMPYLDYPCDVLQTRREWDKYDALIRASALLHQHQRKIGRDAEGEFVEASVEDVALANKLVLEFFANSMEEMAPHTRRLGEELSAMVEERGDASFTRRDLRLFTGWTEWSVRTALEQLEELGYVHKVQGRNGIRMVYEMLVDVREEERKRPVLTDPSELKRRIREAKTMQAA
jgi:DNA primase